jgi:hypothetical protein
MVATARSLCKRNQNEPGARLLHIASQLHNLRIELTAKLSLTLH